MAAERGSGYCLALNSRYNQAQAFLEGLDVI